jgi:chorismate mutase / prephenate dehydratase
VANDDKDLAPLRAKIDALDQQLLELLGQRAQAAQEVGKVKHGTNAPVFRPERERQVIDGLIAKNKSPIAPEGITYIWREIMSACRALEAPVRVAYLGPAGTFSEQAAFAQFGQSISGVPCATIDEVFRAVDAGAAEFGVVPVENSSEGAVSRTLDLLLDTDLRITGEIALMIKHHLLTKTGTLNGVTKVFAHPQALAQCQRWLATNTPALERQAVSSNGEAAKIAAADSTIAAIAGDIAQQQYGLSPVQSSIQDDPHNRTRFVVISHGSCQASGKDQTSVILSVTNKPGAVYHLLAPLAKHGVSMNRFESRPARRGTWEYFFYIDIDGHANDPKVAAALAELETEAAFFKNLGSYPRSH